MSSGSGLDKFYIILLLPKFRHSQEATKDGVIKMPGLEVNSTGRQSKAPCNTTWQALALKDRVSAFITVPQPVGRDAALVATDSGSPSLMLEPESILTRLIGIDRLLTVLCGLDRVVSVCLSDLFSSDFHDEAPNLQRSWTFGS